VSPSDPIPLMRRILGFEPAENLGDF
jgi:hypothetical protein